MTGKYALIATAVAAAAGIAWYATRSRGASGTGPASGPSAPIGSDAGTAPPPVEPIRSQTSHAPVIVVPDASEQAVAAPPPAPSIDDAAPGRTLDQTFAAEDRDRVWAPGHERELRDRLSALPAAPVTITGLECRTHQCRITITARDDAAIGTYVGLLEEPAGLHGWADMMVLEGVSALPGGERQTRIYARFARPQPDDNAPK